VFSWSPRKGTAAAQLPGRVEGPVARERSARLRELGGRLSYSFRKGFEGKQLDGVLLGEARALTGNYIDVRLEQRTSTPGDLIGVKICRVTPSETTALAVAPPSWALA